jgi:hypothetical protein
MMSGVHEQGTQTWRKKTVVDSGWGGADTWAEWRSQGSGSIIIFARPVPGNSWVTFSAMMNAWGSCTEDSVEMRAYIDFRWPNTFVPGAGVNNTNDDYNNAGHVQMNWITTTNEAVAPGTFPQAAYTFSQGAIQQARWLYTGVDGKPSVWKELYTHAYTPVPALAICKIHQGSVHGSWTGTRGFKIANVCFSIKRGMGFQPVSN